MMLWGYTVSNTNASSRHTSTVDVLNYLISEKSIVEWDFGNIVNHTPHFLAVDIARLVRRQVNGWGNPPKFLP
jgi:hypothetical protein